jgi:formylglycine-generating enzyme required for sulfatase activity
MKPTRSIPSLFAAALLCLVLWALQPPAVAQAPVGLAIQTYAGYAGLTITGSVGTVYTVQYTTNLAQPSWRGAGVVQLPSSPYLWVDTGAPVAGHRFYRAVAGPTNMVWIPAGTFTMGSPTSELERVQYEGPQTVVTLTRGFFMGKYELTQGEYVAVIGSNPSYFRNGTPPQPDGGGTGTVGSGTAVTQELRHPVEMVSWNDATNYCARLSSRERVAGRLPAGWVYRLPTNAEWEYGCRGGTTSAFHYGPALRSGMENFDGRYEYDSSLGRTNNTNGIWLGRTTVVGSYVPNGWGLYDMHGNVGEWCSDWFDTSGLPGGSVIDPQGPTESSFRVLRGGSWGIPAWLCRSAYYHGAMVIPSRPASKNFTFGIRVVLAPGQ